MNRRITGHVIFSHLEFTFEKNQKNRMKLRESLYEIKSARKDHVLKGTRVKRMC